VTVSARRTDPWTWRAGQHVVPVEQTAG
jgi:hypothetical protein